MNKPCLIMICVGLAFNVNAADKESEPTFIQLKEKVNQAILKFEQTKQDLWSYKVSRYENEEGDITSSIEQYSAQADDKWILKQINGQVPSQKEMTIFAENKQQHSKSQNQEGNVQVKLRKLIDKESLSLVSNDKSNFVMAFNVNLNKLGKDSVGKLQGQLTYHKGEQFIETISIWNTAEFSPMFTAKITDLAITFTFAHINGAVLTKQNEMKMKGSFAYFTEINETSLDIFSDYSYLDSDNQGKHNIGEQGH